jgi:diguanylate cyclase (GGDEF)-like protein
MFARAMDWLQAMSFRGRLLALLLFIALLQVVASSMTFHELQSAPAQERAERQVVDAVQSTMTGHLNASLDRARERVQLIAMDPALQQAIIDGNAAAVTGLLEAAGDAAKNVRVSRADGKELAAAPGDDSAERLEAASLPLRREGRLVGTLHADVALDDDFLAGAAQLTPTTPFVVRDGELRSQRGTAKLEDSDLEEGFRTIEVDGRRQLVYLQQVPESKDAWFGAGVPTSKIAAERAEGRTGLWLFVVVLVVLMAIVSVLVTSAIGQAVGAFGRVAERLAGGHLDERIPVTGDDELARVSVAFNDMADQLEERITTLEDTQAKLRRQLQLFGDVLGHSGEIGDVLNTVCRAAIDTTSATRARFWTIGAGGTWQLAACVGLRADDTEPQHLELEALKRGHAIAVGATPQWLIVPSSSGSEPVGILTLVRDDGELSSDDIRLVEHLARQAAAAIDTARLHDLQREQATRDGLTGLANHRHMQDVLATQVAKAHSGGEPLAVILFDVDNFKRINDTYGHDVGDRALRGIAGVIADPMVEGSLSARYGGEEFVVTLPGCNQGRALEIAEQFRRGIEALRFDTAKGELRITSSFGLCLLDQFPGATATPQLLLTHADEALYAAKHAGKNRVELAAPDGGEAPALRLVA